MSISRFGSNALLKKVASRPEKRRRKAFFHRRKETKWPLGLHFSLDKTLKGS